MTPDPRPRPVLAVVGPTAGGKTEIAIELARRLPGGGECVCADSMQVYRGMDIGTAKPTAAQRAAVPHHLLDVADPADDGFTVDTWFRLAGTAIDAIRGRGGWPVIVGGTNLYIQTLMFGLLDGPAPDPELRARLAEEPAEALRRRLEEADPEAASRIHPNDRKRTVRALEVHERTGRPISEMQTHWAADEGPRDDLLLIGLSYPAEAINPRINARVRRMIEDGLVDETTRLREAGLGRQAREALGYRQIIDHLEGRCSLDDAVEQIKIRTRRYAKQQRTWLRRFAASGRAVWLEPAESDTEDIMNKALTASIGMWREGTAAADELGDAHGIGSEQG